MNIMCQRFHIITPFTCRDVRNLRQMFVYKYLETTEYFTIEYISLLFK